MVVKTAFTDAWIRSLPPPAKAQELHWDARLPTFGLRVGKTAKTFIIKLNNDFITIGRFGILGLAEAREEARRILAERTLGKVRPQSITYPQALKLFLEEKAARCRPTTVRDHTRHLGLLGFTCRVSDVSHADMERKLKRLPPGEFNHRLACSKTFFAWAQRKRYRDDDPTRGLSPHPRETRSRVLSDDELGRVWKAAEQTEGHFGTIVKLLLLTGQRRGEVAALRADYISNDTCTFPATLTKNGRQHSIPLSGMAKSLLASSASSLTGKSYLFAARGKPNSPFNGWSKSKAALDKISGVSGWVLHDARRTFATRLAELGVSPHVIERLLNHVTGTVSGVAAVYNRASYMAEMRAAIALWDQYLREKVL